MENIITGKIKAMFQFIEFLHSNIENFKQFDGVINELNILVKEREELSPRQNFKDKLKYDEVQVEIKDKFKVIQENIIFPIRNKAIELDIDNFQNEPSFNWNGIESDIHNIKENFNNEDILEILKHKGKYLKFRTETNCKYFQDHFFNSLDRILKELFDFFKESSENEFEVFETKTIHVNTIHEAVERIISKTSTAEPQSEDKDKVETTEQKVRRLLAPLKEISKTNGSVIIENASYEKLVKTYVNYIDKKEYPERAERFCIYGSNPEFYGILKKLHKELPLKIAGIGQALTFILSQNNQYGESGKSIALGTIEKNIKNGGQY